MSNRHPPQQTVSSSEADVPEATILRGASKETTPPLRGTPPSQEGSRKNSPPEKGEYPEGGRGLIPKLRFPEFREAGEWESGFVKDLIVAITPPKKLTSDLYKKEGQFPVIDQSQDYICGWTNDKSALILCDFPLIIFGDHTCVLKLVNRPFAQGADGIKILKADEVIDPEYLYQYLLLAPVKMESYKRHFATLKEKLVVYPAKKKGEQQKIADCLSSLDTLIAAQAEKIDALKTHKKGLMQQLFPQEGETVPRLRFHEFRDAGEWGSDIVGSLVDLLSGYAFKSEYFSEAAGEKLLTPKNFTKNGFSSFTSENTKYTKEKCDQRYICKEGDLLMVLTDLTPTCELLGRPLLLSQGDGSVLLNQRIVKVMPKKNIEKRFLLYFFLTDGFRKRITDTATGSTVRHSSNTIVASTNIQLPSLPEQKKISDCLSSLDALITAEKEKLNALKTHKKGLMQQLFPAVENEAGS